MTRIDPRYDFRSDTVTVPTADMRRAMLEAEVGDDVFGEDPTVNVLQDRVAQMVGKQAALFFPSGCMANLTALMTHAIPGKALFAGQTSHIKLFELGSYARIAGLNFFSIQDGQGFLDLDDLKRRWPGRVYYLPEPGVIAVENTHNMGGGLVYPVEELSALRGFAESRATPIHMDGARLFHAAVASNLPLTMWTNQVDSVMVCMSKGLGAPVGSVLAGSTEFIECARPIRKLLGGGMRQVGMLAAAGLYALEHHWPLLERDHTRCLQVYEHLCDSRHVTVRRPETNILIAELNEPRAEEFAAFLRDRGVGVIAFGPDRLRFVFHLCLADDAVERLILTIGEWESGA